MQAGGGKYETAAFGRAALCAADLLDVFQNLSETVPRGHGCRRDFADSPASLVEPELVYLLAEREMEYLSEDLGDCRHPADRIDVGCAG